MSCNPCCCWRLKDAAVTIGIWSTIYAIACLAMFAWQWGVLAQCQHVTMAQSNLQCEYYCPCVGASTARTSAIIEGFFVTLARVKIFCIMQLGLFGWQMAAIKWEKDRAANTLLPNYNTYGRYDIPSYYESYWQSPEERYYTGLFVIQILCLIASFFLLFSSIMLIYGVHTWSRYLVWPWFICMSSSILTSLAYCIIWWAGDVRDYWLVLTILQIFCVFLNCYCFVVIAVFYKRMGIELDYYEAKRAGDVYGRPTTTKYDRFIQQRTPQTTIDQDFDDGGGDDFGPGAGPAGGGYGGSRGRGGGGWDEWRDGYPSDPHPPAFGQQPVYMPSYPYPQQTQGYQPALQPQDGMRPRSVPPELIPTRSAPSAFETEDVFKDVPRQENRRRSQRSKHRSSCRHCEHSHHRHSHCHCHSHYGHRSHHHKHHRGHHHGHRHRKSSEQCSSDGVLSSTNDYNSGTESTSVSHRNQGGVGGKHQRQRPGREDSDFLGGAGTSTLDRRGSRRPAKEPSAAARQKGRKEGATPTPVTTTTFPRASGGEPISDLLSPPPLPPSFAGGFTIPQHIVIPPSHLQPSSDSTAERKYQIQSEITISYDPLRGQVVGGQQPARGETGQSPLETGM